MHPIDAHSPLHGLTKKDLQEQALELMCVLVGIDETSSQSVHARKSYVADDMRFGERFEDIIGTLDDGTRVIDYRKFHETRPAKLDVAG